MGSATRLGGGFSPARKATRRSEKVVSLSRFSALTTLLTNSIRGLRGGEGQTRRASSFCGAVAQPPSSRRRPPPIPHATPTLRLHMAASSLALSETARDVPRFTAEPQACSERSCGPMRRNRWPTQRRGWGNLPTRGGNSPVQPFLVRVSPLIPTPLWTEAPHRGRDRDRAWSSSP